MADYFCADRITRIRKYTDRAMAFITGNEEIAGRASQNPESQSQSQLNGIIAACGLGRGGPVD